MRGLELVGGGRLVVTSAIGIYVAGVSAYHFSLHKDFGPLIDRSRVPLGILICGILLIVLAASF